MAKEKKIVMLIITSALALIQLFKALILRSIDFHNPSPNSENNVGTLLILVLSLDAINICALPCNDPSLCYLLNNEQNIDVFLI